MIELPSNLDRDAQLLDLDRVDAEESLYTFFRGAWRYIDPAPWVDGWCMEAIAEHLEAVRYGQIRRLICNISPRCSKSNLVSVAFPAWVWAQPQDGPISGPGVPFLHASYTNQLSLRDSVKCRRLIESEWYQARWGNRFNLTTDQNTKSRFTNNKGGERLITSIDGTGTGEGGMCFIAGTLVCTPAGQRRIENICPGDQVFAFDLQQERVVISRVVAVAERKSSDLCQVREVSGRSFTCTTDHPIYSPGRGFIAACELGEGDAVLVSGARAPPDRNPPSSDLRQLWEEAEETPVPTTQGIETGQSRLLLRHQVPQPTSFRQKLNSFLQNVRKGPIASACQVLFQKVQTSAGKLERKVASYLQNLWRQIPKMWVRETILLKEVRRRRSFEAHEGFSEFEIQGARHRSLLESVQGHACDHTTTGRILLHGLRSIIRNCEAFVSSENIAACPSYRRESEEQPPREPDNVVRAMSPPASHWHVAHIEEIARYRGEEVSVYDIQVEGTSNFFAEGILVHNCVIIDDPNSVDDVDSEATIQTAIDWWTGVMPTRLNNQETGAYIIIQQRTFENDLTGHILETEGEDWVHLMIPMRYEPERSYFMPVTEWKDPRTEPGELMWPERFSEASVKRLETRLGPFRAAGQLQQRPEPAGGGIILREWWKLWEADSYPPFDFVLGCLDTAFTEEEMNDPSGMIIWGIFSGDIKAVSTGIIVPKRLGEMNAPTGDDAIKRMDMTYSEFAPHVMCMWAWEDRLRLHELVQKVAATCIKMKVDLLVIENKASGISVAQEIQRLYAREKFGVQLFDPKSQDKMARLVSVQHLFAEGIIYGPDRPWMERVITQVGQFPKSKNDEFVDLTSMGLRKLRDMGLLVRQPEREAELEERKIYPRGQDSPLYPA